MRKILDSRGCGRKLGPMQVLEGVCMYSEEQGLRALEAYEECGHRVTETI